jgi:hypothetical protein
MVWFIPYAFSSYTLHDWNVFVSWEEVSFVLTLDKHAYSSTKSPVHNQMIQFWCRVIIDVNLRNFPAVSSSILEVWGTCNKSEGTVFVTCICIYNNQKNTVTRRPTMSLENIRLARCKILVTVTKGTWIRLQPSVPRSCDSGVLYSELLGFSTLSIA